jgi:hypothetical protein
MTDDSDDTADELAENLLDELGSGETATATTAPDPTATTGDGDSDDDTVESTFLVTAADDASAILQDVHTGQIHTLSENPDFVAESVVEATVQPEPPMNATFEVADVESRREVEITVAEESPTPQATDIAAEQSVGEITRKERAGTGEIHVITVPDDQTESAVEDVTADRERRLTQAARVGAAIVEVRSAPGLVEVRYLP